MVKISNHVWQIPATFVFLCSLFIAPNTARSLVDIQKCAHPDAATFRVEVQDQEVSIEVKDARIAHIFCEIGKQTGILMEIPEAFDDRITIQFNHVPLAEAMARLANVAIFYHSNASLSTITRVVVSPKREKSDNRHPSPPAPSPDPFEFIFDPTGNSEGSDKDTKPKKAPDSTSPPAPEAERGKDKRLFLNTPVRAVFATGFTDISHRREDV